MTEEFQCRRRHISTLTCPTEVLSGLEPEARAFLMGKAATRDVGAGDVIFEERATMTGIVFPHEGVISLMSQMEDGRSVEKGSVGNEGVIGVSLVMGGGPALGRSVVQIAGSASWVSTGDLDEALGRFRCVRQSLLRYAAAHIVQLMELVACNSLHNAEQRVSRWLLHAHDRVRGDSFYVTQEALARLLSLRRATVNVVCSDLMRAGAISYHRGNLTISDRDLLHGRACQCYDRVCRAALPE